MSCIDKLPGSIQDVHENPQDRNSLQIKQRLVKLIDLRNTTNQASHFKVLFPKGRMVNLLIQVSPKIFFSFLLKDRSFTRLRLISIVTRLRCLQQRLIDYSHELLLNKGNYDESTIIY